MASTKLRLFMLRDTTTGKLIPNTFFADKALAKRARDSSNEQGNKLVVTYGPDHRHYKPTH